MLPCIEVLTLFLTVLLSRVILQSVGFTTSFGGLWLLILYLLLEDSNITLFSEKKKKKKGTVWICLFLGCSEDMKTLFVNEYLNTSLPVLNFGEERAISILASRWSSCEVDLNYSWYFGCEDSRLWSIHYLNVLSNLLTLNQRNSHYILKVRNKLW